MASPDTLPIWVPYETIKDCSQGFCSIYCPQWCYTIFPPPPPYGFSDEPSGPNLSPLVVAVIGILASAFLLVGYYAIISKYGARLDSLRRRLQGRDPPDGDGPGENPPGGFRLDAWYAPAGGGLEEEVIKSIAVFKYHRGEGVVDGTDCSVCLSEFREDDTLRLLPKCSHAFHVPCIDTWLKSHASCPLCRANIVSPYAAAPLPSPPPPLPARPTAPLEPQGNPPSPEVPQDGIVAEDAEMGRGGEEESAGGPVQKNPLRLHRTLGMDGGLNGRDQIVELVDEGVQPIRRSVSMDASRLSRVRVADVLGMDIEADFPVATKDPDAMSEGVGPSRGYGAEQRGGKDGSRSSRMLHGVANPAPMKRSFSSGRFCFSGQGKGSHGVLPL